MKARGRVEASVRWGDGLVAARGGGVFWEEAVLAFEACFLGDVEGCVAPCECVFCKAASGRVHFVKRSYSVSGLELCDISANSVDYPCYIVAVVEGFVGPFCVLWGTVVRL